MYVRVCFFFCKQKTAYEMRISDWSSDVCSSDLRHRARRLAGGVGDPRRPRRGRADAQLHPGQDGDSRRGRRVGGKGKERQMTEQRPLGPRTTPGDDFVAARSEEHTSELPSLMRISYAVFCLKQKTQPLLPTIT